jgi:hypothetical protein
VLAVQETITFLYDGAFTGAFREVPLRTGETISDVSVSEGNQAYRPGASAEIGSSGDPGTFGTARTDDGIRIVWHYRAQDAVRSFTIRYRLAGLAVAHDDVVDVNLKVWGDEWEVGLGNLTALLFLPHPASGSAYRVWGHPVFVRGDVTRDPMSATLRAVDVPARQFVELRVVFPREVLESVEGARASAATASRRSSPRSERTRRSSSATASASTTRSTTSGGRSPSCWRWRSFRPRP